MWSDPRDQAKQERVIGEKSAISAPKTFNSSLVLRYVILVLHYALVLAIALAAFALMDWLWYSVFKGPIISRWLASGGVLIAMLASLFLHELGHLFGRLARWISFPCFRLRTDRDCARGSTASIALQCGVELGCVRIQLSNQQRSTSSYR